MTRSFLALLLGALLSCSSLTAAWNPLGSGLISSRSMTSHAGDLYVACFPTGIQKSINGGTSWTQVNTGLPQSAGNYYVRSVGSNGTWLFVGTESGVYRSDNGGATWANTNGSLTASSTVYANRFYTFGGVTMAMFAGTIANGGGIWRTSTGSSWSIGHSGMGSNAVVNHLKQVGNSLYASTSVGLFKSLDNGLSWTAVASANYATFALAESNGNLVINCTFGIRYSTNNGASWFDATGDPSNPTAGDLMAFDGKVYALCPSPTGCLISYDQGVTWAAFNSGFGAADAISQDELYTDGTTLYCLAILDIYSIDGVGQGIPNSARTKALLYPSPAVNGFWLELANPLEQGQLVMLDAMGREVNR
ncbi:MAG: hypothetical protein IT229_04945, partial [Flavobacteriales bacterium]|nr:hypothetical protein [Flavobacteriales bacterium]